MRVLVALIQLKSPCDSRWSVTPGVLLDICLASVTRRGNRVREKSALRPVLSHSSRLGDPPPLLRLRPQGVRTTVGKLDKKDFRLVDYSNLRALYLYRLVWDLIQINERGDYTRYRYSSLKRNYHAQPNPHSLVLGLVLVVAPVLAGGRRCRKDGHSSNTRVHERTPFAGCTYQGWFEGHRLTGRSAFRAETRRAKRMLHGRRRPPGRYITGASCNHVS